MTGFLFIPEGGDVQFTVNVDDAVTLEINGVKVIDDFNCCDGPTNNFTATGTATNLPAGFVPIRISFAEAEFPAFVKLSLSVSGGGLPSGIIPQAFLFSQLPENMNQMSWQGPSGDFSQIFLNDDGSYTRLFKNGLQNHYTSTGLLSERVDRNNNITAYAYNSNDQLISISDPMGLVTQLNYSGGLLSSIQDPAGRVTSFDHDSQGNLIQITDPDNSVRSFAYDSNHQMTRKTDKLNFDTIYLFNQLGQNYHVELADGSSRSVVVNSNKALAGFGLGNGGPLEPIPYIIPRFFPTVFTDGEGNDSTFLLNRFGGVTQEVNSNNIATLFAYNEDGQVIEFTGSARSRIEYTYDELGNLVKRAVVSAGREEFFSYTAFNLLASFTNLGGFSDRFFYDENGNLEVIQDKLNNSTTLTYNGQGQALSQTNALNETTMFSYEIDTGNLERITDPLSNQTQFFYDDAGNVITTTNAEGHSTQFEYDLMNRLTKIVDANNGVTEFFYDAQGHLTSVKDAKNQVTNFVYNEVNQLITRVDSLNNSESFEYDGNGTLIKTTTRNGDVIEYKYDSVGRFTEKRVLKGGSTIEDLVTFSYDDNDNLILALDNDSRVEFTYDASSFPDGQFRLLQSSVSLSQSQPDAILDYNYDTLGRLQLVTDSWGGSVQVGYDDTDRVRFMRTPSGSILQFFRDDLGRLEFLTRPNDTSTFWTRDAAGRTTMINHSRISQGGNISADNYAFDQNGNVTFVSSFRDGVFTQDQLISYDNLGQVVGADRPLNSEPARGFVYDSVGNRLSDDQSTITNVFNSANQLLEDSDFTYMFDLNGNLIEKVNKTTNERFEYVYNVESQLTEYRNFLSGSPIPQTEVFYRYDALGRRIQKNVNGSARKYIYDREDIFLEFDGSDSLIARYTHRPGIDQPLVMERNGQEYFYFQDRLGNITGITDASGNFVQSYTYEAFGNVKVFNGSGVLIPFVSSLENPYTYTGREYDVESGMYYYRARYYNPGTGRFMQEDPIGLGSGGFNFYQYVLNNPLNLVDHFGQAPTRIEDEEFEIEEPSMDPRRIPSPGRTPLQPTIPPAEILPDILDLSPPGFLLEPVPIDFEGDPNRRTVQIHQCGG